ncbi:NADH:flavin oxidoreductases [Pelotomaculum thermopropionicum SI]|uniref:NADH:flavin oxidoreductases n=1 Tax=Pelotomaculum thermopropionicum (strain DSM 13744 / JCM 10971 / SI) TaxID=370438 RepID=A5D4R8_PELTS|nr:NADH:flavin oxidoreductases [Pelotomaculum thermopropionicum SI]
MNPDYHFLFSPIRIGPVTVRNRIVFPAHLTNYAVNNLPSDRHAFYYGERARGGAGLIITEEQSVHPTDRAYEKLIDGCNPAVVPGYRRITGEVHRYGGKIFAQLNHNGQQASGAFSGLPVWGPSSIPDPLFREVPKAMEKSDIQEVIRGFCLVAGHVIRGGFDGIEVQASHSSLLRQFMSPLTNERTDEYGGSFENRMRLTVELMTALRRITGGRLALGIRLSGDELVDGGLTLAEARKAAAYLCELKLVDFINTSIASFHNLYMVMGSMHVPPGYGAFIAASIREVADVPVFAAGRINTPAQAERLLASGQADMVAIARGQICDPEFAVKALEGREDEIRYCISCNQCCAARTGLNRDLSCLQNPAAGREEVFGCHSVVKPARLKKIMVIGGGPAGLAAAGEAARRGHQVTLFERENMLGGQVNLIARLPGRSEFAEVIRNQVKELRSLPVKVELGVEVTAGLVEREKPDAVIVAAGSEAVPCGLPGAGLPHVMTFYEVLAGREVPGKRVLVVDETGFYQGAGTAEYLARLNKKVFILTSCLYAGPDLMPTMDLPLWYRRVLGLGAEMIVNSIVTSIEPGRVTVMNHYTGRENVLEGIDNVVLALHPGPRDEIYRMIKGKVPEVYRIGDCLAPRRVEHAIYEGFKTGRSI